MSIVKKAAHAFQQGDYAVAKQFYQQASERYGHQLFAVNITLCERALTPGYALKASSEAAQLVDNTSQKLPSGATEQQLQETQQMLEHYFTRCQQLEYQLLDH